MSWNKIKLVNFIIHCFMGPFYWFDNYAKTLVLLQVFIREYSLLLALIGKSKQILNGSEQL